MKVNHSANWEISIHYNIKPLNNAYLITSLAGFETAFFPKFEGLDQF